MRTISTLTALLAMDTTAAQSAAPTQFTLQDFYGDHAHLAHAVEEIYALLSKEQQVAQMIISSLGEQGKPYAAVEPLIEHQKIGGILFLGGSPDALQAHIVRVNEISAGFPLLMSVDAEPSLFNRRLPGSPDVPKTIDLKTTQEVRNTVQTINHTLREVGFQHNYAPVIDMSPENESIGNRAFGNDAETIVTLALEFIQVTQAEQIIATAKHFPGHGRVSGDTHKALVTIDGELTEVELYKPMIQAGVISVMVGHIAVENNPEYSTDGLPSTLSPVIVTKLLREELGFKGLIVTDALNMGAVAAMHDAALKAARAGCDLILMPFDEEETHQLILKAAESDPAFAAQVEASVKRIIRAKLCLGMRFE